MSEKWTKEPFDTSEEQIHPIQFVQIGSLLAVPVPLARITTCGSFQFQVLHEVLPTTPPQGCYRNVTLKNRPKGSGTALILLKILTSQPEHATSTDWLSEHLSGTRRFKEDDDDEEWERGMARVDNVALYLRGMLCPLWMDEQDKRTLRKLLLKTLRNHRDSGTSYQLAPSPLVWLDVDEIAEAIRLACLREERGKDALPSWEQAHALASRGPFLPPEPYSDWATSKRTEVDGYLRQSVHALRRLLLLRYGESSENRVIFLLRQYWQRHLTDEEALQQLMELLSKHGSMQEAQKCYQRLCEYLKENGDKPDQRTQEVAQNLVRFGQSVALAPDSESIYSFSSQKRMQKFFTREILQKNSATHYTPNSMGDDSLQRSQEYNTSLLPDGQLEGTDISSSSGQHASSYTLESGIAFIKEARRRLLQHMLNRAGSAIIAQNIFLDNVQLEQNSEVSVYPSKIGDFTLSYLEAITRNHWHLFLHAPSKSDLLSSFWGHLQTILQFLKYSQSGTIRNSLYSIASESAQMIGEILFDIQDYHHAQIYYDFSVDAAKEAGNNVLRAIGLGRLSFLPIYRDEPLQAYPLLEEAKQLLASVSRPIVYSWLAVVEAEVLAHLHDKVACEQALERASVSYQQEGPEEDKLWTRLNDATIPGYEGACYLQLHQPQKALISLKKTLSSIPEYSLRHQSLILTDIAAAMQQMEEVEEACTHLHHALQITTQTKSLMVLIRMQQVRKRLEPWKETFYVKQLDQSISDIFSTITP